MPITYSLADLFNNKLSGYPWNTRKGGADGNRTAVEQSLELRVRLRSHYATNFDDQKHGLRKRYGLVFADTTSLLTFNMDSTPGHNITKHEQSSFASRMKTQFPEGKEYIIELFQDHYTALKTMALDPQDAVKYGTLQPYILQLRRPIFTTPISNTTDILRVHDAAWPYIQPLNEIWPSNPPIPRFTIPDLGSTIGRVTGSIFSFIGYVIRVENRKQAFSPEHQATKSTPPYKIIFVDVTELITGEQTINIYSNANTVLLRGVLSMSRACPAVAVFTGFSRNEQFISSTSSSRVRHLDSEADIEDLFQDQLSDVTKASIIRHLRDDVHVRHTRCSSILIKTTSLNQASTSTRKHTEQVVHAVHAGPASSPTTTNSVKRHLESTTVHWNQTKTRRPKDP
jgi:hypothetical protein